MGGGPGLPVKDAMLPLRLSEIARMVGGDLVGPGDPLLTGAAGLSEAGAGDLSFVTDSRRAAAVAASGAGALLVGPELTVDKPCVRVNDPYRAFTVVLARLQIDLDRAFPPGIHETAIVAASADVSQAVAVGPFCVVGDGSVLGPGTRLGSHVSLGCDVSLGADCLVYPQAVIREGCRLGSRVIVHAGVVLGSDGFGYLPDPQGLHKIPQVGIVVLEDDVELGAGVTVDRATTGQTVIGQGTKVDNQVQIAHNVRIGRHCALSAQVGIAGSATLGDGVVFGGQVGVGDHLTIGSGTTAGGQAGITRSLAPGSRVFGTPAEAAHQSFRATAALRRLPDLLAEIRRLRTEITELQTRLAPTEDGPGPAVEDQEN
jgi:UDP-3-O-[3-hydroxymyristoyl] glucosamine N-acyltransferase